MTFAELRGRKGRTRFMSPGGVMDLDTTDVERASWELVEEPAKPAPACESCVNLRKHIEVREASETEARATIARLERELAEAKRPKERSRMLILAARAFADEHRVSPSEPVDVECSFVDWFRSELIGASCVLPKSNVVLSPYEALREGELRVKP